MLNVATLFQDQKIAKLLALQTNDSEIKEILSRAEERKGLELVDCAKLLSIQDPRQLELLFQSAYKVKQAIYGPRIVLFAPIYISDYCVNDCSYCAFHISNNAKRRRLNIEEIKEQVVILQNMGHKRLLLECGEDPLNNPIDYVVEAIDTIYSVKSKNGAIRRVNVNIAATTVENYRKLKAAQIGTYQLFQETFHFPTYCRAHSGPKADFNRQIEAPFRAFEAGIDDLGIGVLFGLYDYRFEVLALLQYVQIMENILKVGPHTISVPRFRPAHTVNLKLEHLVNDRDYLKIIAILRLAVPYTGLIISTREAPDIRRKGFDIGISQASAYSKTSPGGYSSKGCENEQFKISDERSLDEVVQDICRMGYLPSFCTACYRSERTGDKFMQLAKSGKINNFCNPNALLTFKEYLLDYAKEETKKIGEKLIQKQIATIPSPILRKFVRKKIAEMDQKKRDVYV